MRFRPSVKCVMTLSFIMLIVFSWPAGAQETLPTRDQIPEKCKWDLTTIYADQQAWKADFKRATKDIAKLEALKEAAFDSPEALLTTLTLRDDTRWLVDKLLVYAHQLSDQDTRHNEALGLKNRATTLYVSYGQATAWIEPTLQTVPEDTLRSWWQDNDRLRICQHYLEDVIRKKAHTLSPREEELLAMAGNLGASPGETYNVLKNAETQWPTIRDEEGNEVTLSPARYNKFVRSTDRRVRRDAFMGTMATLAQYRNTFAATLNGMVQRNIYYARARGFESPLASTLFPDNLPRSVYTNLVDTIHEHLPLLHRWAALRKKVMGVDQLHVYDLYQSLVEGKREEIPYDDAVAMVIAALQPLGPEYCRPMEKGFASRWVDVYESQGKRPGGYSWGSYDTHPYVLLNYSGTPRERSVIAHEMGHSMHSYLTHKHQPKVYGEYSMFVAEVAAIFNEILLEEYLLKQATTRQEKLRLLNEQIDNLRGTVFRQVMFAEFEYEAHALAQRGEPLTADRLGQLYMDTFHKYWGPEVVRDPEDAVYWARIPHFYMNHYVYRYASSYCAAAALAEGVLHKKPGALEAYLGFLKAGSSDYPLEILRKAGVDITRRGPIEATMRRFERLMEEMKRLLEHESAAKPLLRKSGAS